MRKNRRIKEEERGVGFKPGKLYVVLGSATSDYEVLGERVVGFCPEEYTTPANGHDVGKVVLMFLGGKYCDCNKKCNVFYFRFLGPDGKIWIHETNRSPDVAGSSIYYLNAHKLFTEVKREKDRKK